MINIAEILKDYPKGTKLYSPIFGDCILSKVAKDGNIQVLYSEFQSKTPEFLAVFNKYGQRCSFGECTLFPFKNNRDWNGFRKPSSFKPFDKVVVRDTGVWHIDFFEQYIPENEHPYRCMTCSWKICLPYNEETAKLVGTSDDYNG